MLMHPDAPAVLSVIQITSGLRVSQVIAALPQLSRERVEDAIWDLYSRGMIQIGPDSTMRVTRDGEKIFRYDAP